MPPSHAPAMSDRDEFSQFSTGLQPFCFVCAGTPTYTSVEMAEEYCNSSMHDKLCLALSD